MSRSTFIVASLPDLKGKKGTTMFCLGTRKCKNNTDPQTKHGCPFLPLCRFKSNKKAQQRLGWLTVRRQSIRITVLRVSPGDMP